jgi:hypothetical protein
VVNDNASQSSDDSDLAGIQAKDTLQDDMDALANKSDEPDVNNGTSVEDRYGRFKPLLEYLFHQQQAGSGEVQMFEAFKVIGGNPPVPDNFNSFIVYTREAREAGFIVDRGYTLSIAPTPTLHYSLGSKVVQETTNNHSCGEVISCPAAILPSSPSRVSPPTSPIVEAGTRYLNVQDVPERFRPLVHALSQRHMEGLARVRLDGLFKAVRGKEHIPSQYTTFLWYIREARDAGLIVDEGFYVALTDALSQLNINALPESVPSAPAVLAQEAITNPEKSPTALVSCSEKTQHSPYARLVEVLRRQQTSGWHRSQWSYVTLWISGYANSPTFTANYQVRDYLRDAQRAGVVEIEEPNGNGDGWVWLPSQVETSTLPISSTASVSQPVSTPSFEPLLQLFDVKGRLRLNLGELSELKLRHPDLIEHGKGMVKAYAQRAATAGVVRLVGNEWVELISHPSA